jgi:preprotein translocase subunit SecA
MVARYFKKLLGSRNDRQLRRMGKIVTRINALESETQALDDAALRARTDEFRARVANGTSLDDILPEAFAVVREAGRRVLEMRHFDVQLIGGIVLHEGHIAEMRTGEGKTLVATLPAYLNALGGTGVHIVTVNDYLARRDAEWMGQLYGFLGMSTGVVVPGQSPDEKRTSYGCDVVYGTNNEYGFDYLRDNMAFSAAERMQGRLGFAVVDEVDSILIDEARTPLIISGPTDENSDLYIQINRLIPSLTRQAQEDGPGDFTVDEKSRQVFLTEEGHAHAEELLESAGLLKTGESLYDAANIVLMHHLNAGLRAHALFTRDKDYIVRDRQVVIVDEFTGRTLAGRRWSEGLHQAIEAKEGVPIQNENQTLASITFQNYFRLYERLSGMTGTADTEAAEFQQIYGLEVMVIPTHMPMVRDDRADLVYLTKQEKFDAIIEDIRDCHARGQPALVGTTSIETSEYLSGLLERQTIPHAVLNAKQHEREAQIIQHAGRPGTVTIATNMAGRGTDIVLGGNPQADLAALPEDDHAGREAIRAEWRTRHDAAIAAGGLHIIGTERHESRRIDNQLRGRAGRQGDAGSSRFYLSLEDDLMRIFASERVATIMQKLGMEPGEAIEHRWVTKAIENAQRKVEARNFDMRKQLLEYDDVANDQRKEIYSLRNELMAADEVEEQVAAIREDVVGELVDRFIPPQSLEEQWDVPGLEAAIEQEFGSRLEVGKWLQEDDTLHEEPLRAKILQTLTEHYREKERITGSEIIRHFEKAVMLQVLDQAWKEHLAAMDYLRQGIHLRGYAQKNPKQEYKREAFEMFAALTERIKHEVISVLSKIQVRAQEDVQAVEEQRRLSAQLNLIHEAPPVPALADGEGEGEGEGENDDEAPTVVRARPAPRAGLAFTPPQEAEDTRTPYVRDGRKVGRNEPCPCGSGKKFKQCHGKVA